MPVKQPEGFIPLHGGYRNLLTYQKAEIIYDGTVWFCNHYLQKRDRTIDQMVQAAPSFNQVFRVALCARTLGCFQSAEDFCLPRADNPQAKATSVSSTISDAVPGVL